MGVNRVDFNEFLRDTWQTTLIFATLLVLARLLGKTQVGQLNFYEYICGITIGSISANIMAAEPGQVWSHYYDLLLFCGLTFLAARATLVNRPLRKMVEGSPTLVIDNGRILREKLMEQRMDVDELMGQLREQGIFDVAEVQYAVLETTGGLSVLPKAAYKPVVRQDLNIAAAEARLPLELVVDGEIVDDNLERAGVSRDWLRGELAARGIGGTDKVVYAVIDSKGTLQVRTGE